MAPTLGTRGRVGHRLGARLIAAFALLAAGLVAVPLAQGADPAEIGASAAESVRLQADDPGDGAPPLRAAELPLRLPGASARVSGDVAEAPGQVVRVQTDGFSLVAATWDRSAATADPGLRVRARGAGAWTPWQQLETLGDGPTPNTPEGRAARPGTGLLWVGPATELEVTSARPAPAGFALVLLDHDGRSAARAGGSVDPARAIAPADDPAPPEPTPPAPTEPAPAVPDTAPVTTTPTAPVVRPGGKARKPRLRSRKNWKADPSWRSGTVRYSRKIKQVHVHHTATANGYAPKDVKGIIRSMYRYHTQSLGWSDLGYNFIIDRFGRAWVGRAGGAGRLVQGAHTLGFNHNSVGVALIGNFETEQPTAAALDTLARLAAWKLRRHTTPKRNARARGKVRVASRGSRLFSAGTRVRLPRIDGHRDTNTTACPGALLYAQLPQVRRLAQGRIDRT